VISAVELTSFRNYPHREFLLSPSTTVLLGNNATGKTNFLESIYLLATGESFRARIVDEMVHFGEELGRVKAIQKNEPDLEVVVTTGMVGGKRVAKRQYLIDGAGKRKADFVGQLAAVIFRPEDLVIVEGAPAERRRFLDRAISQVDRDYARSLGVYDQALRRRNKLLSGMKEKAVSRHSLTFWNSLLIRHGQVLQEQRLELAAFINDLWERSDLFNRLHLEYSKSLLTEERLEEYADREIAAGHTLIGPHKDDFQLLDRKRDLATYGSRGEQRMAVLGLKLGEVYFLENRREDRVILLLDDIFSELDSIHRHEVLRVMENRQVVLTSAAAPDIELIKAAELINLKPEAKA
jgi:DNA replication and repair protein RecF